MEVMGESVCIHLVCGYVSICLISYLTMFIILVLDLLSMDDSPVNKTSPSNNKPVRRFSSRGSNGGASSFDAKLTDKLPGWLATCLSTASPQKGILFENEVMRVSTVVEYRGHQGRMAVFVLNKSKSPIEGLLVQCVSNEAASGLEVPTMLRTCTHLCLWLSE